MHLPFRHRFAGTLLVLAACGLAGRLAPVSAGGPTDWDVPKLVEAIRAAEKQFANLDTVVKKKRVRPDLAVPVKVRRGKVTTSGGIHEDVTTRSIRQGEFFYSKTSISRKGNSLRTVTVERVVAFDGQRTRTIEVGSAINIHEGRTVLVRNVPPHAWPLSLDVPLSDFLAGSHVESEVRHSPPDSLLDDHFRAPQSAAETRIVGEEKLKELACLKVEFEEEDAKNGDRRTFRLWLAKDRHFIPVKMQVFKEADPAPLPASESRVEDWWEVKKDVWLPKRIVSVTYEDGPSQNGKHSRKESRRETLLLEKASLDVDNPPQFFRELNPPPGLPTFTIKEGRLVDSFPVPIATTGNDEKLQKIIEQLREEENRYNRLSVDATEQRTTNPLAGGNDKTRTTKMHSVLLDDRALTDARHETWHFSGSFRPMLWSEAFDGHTYRAYGRHPPPQKGGYAWISSQNFFARPYTLVPVMLRPHSALLPIDGSSYRRLSEILWPTPGAVPKQLEKEVEYLGEATSGLLPCHVLAVRPAHARQPGFKSLLWLAKERNLVPVRFEEYRPGESLPVRLEIIDKFSEPTRGVWYPAHQTRYIFRQRIAPAVREGYLFVDQCWDYTVNAVSLEPVVTDGAFSQIVVDEGIDVQYFDKNGKLFNKAMQPADGVPEMPAGK